MQAGEPSTALRIFRDLEGSRLSPNHKTVSSIISALSRLRRKGQPSAEIAYQLWAEMHQGGGDLDDVAYRAGEHHSSQSYSSALYMHSLSTRSKKDSPPCAQVCCQVTAQCICNQGNTRANVPTSHAASGAYTYALRWATGSLV